MISKWIERIHFRVELYLRYNLQSLEDEGSYFEKCSEKEREMWIPNISNLNVRMQISTSIYQHEQMWTFDHEGT